MTKNIIIALLSLLLVASFFISDSSESGECLEFRFENWKPFQESKSPCVSTQSWEKSFVDIPELGEIEFNYLRCNFYPCITKMYIRNPNQELVQLSKKEQERRITQVIKQYKCS